MNTALVLGFLLGMRHALESDHVAAVATLATRSGSIRDTVLLGAVWGLGHTLTLVLACSAVLFVGVLIPARVAYGLELAAALMLVVLGVDVVRRLRRGRIHLHRHRHADGTTHVHAHAHQEGLDGPCAHRHALHDHDHLPGCARRALLVGVMHGMAGSAALIMLAIPLGRSALAGLSYVLLFGGGSVAGMALFSAVVAIPLRWSAQRFAGLNAVLQGAVGALSIGIGIALLSWHAARLG